MTFVVVGGGPTGVELAGTIVEIAHKAMPRDFRRIDTRQARVILLEGGPDILSAFPADLRKRARHDLERLGVEVRTDSIVTDIEDHGVHVSDTTIPTRNVFWAAGNQASPLVRVLNVPLDGAGKVIVEDTLTVPGDPRIHVVGDVAAVKRPNGSWVPGVAPAANQEGSHAAANVLRALRGEAMQPFRYHNKGELATIGRHRAIALVAGVKFAGFPAWLFWLFLHVMYLVGFRNRVSVLVQWAYAYATFQRGVRLITETENVAPPVTED
jgi:NADH dehydrogenase